MSVVISGDWHFGVKSFSKKFFDYQLRFFKEQFFPYILENKIKDVIFLGDFIHNQEIMDNYINQIIKSDILSWFGENNVNFWMIYGNHDVYFKNTNEYNYLETIKHFPNIKYVSKPEVIKINNIKFGFTPFGLEENMPKAGECDVLLGHFAFNGFRLNRYSYSRTGLQPQSVSNYKMILSGHYHISSVNKNIHYLGSPYQMDWGDFGNKKGFYKLDEDLSLTFIENKISPQYLKVSYEQSTKKKEPKITIDNGELTITKPYTEALKYIGENFIELQVQKYKNEVQYDFFRNNIPNIQRVQNFQILEDYEKDVLISAEDYDKSNFELLQDFVNEMEYSDEIDKNTFVELFNERYLLATKLANV